MANAYEPRFRRHVQTDLDNALTNFEQAAGKKVADEFFESPMAAIEKASLHPERNHPTPNGLRRCNLLRFKYHFLYRITENEIRIQVLKHDHRRPNFGLRRKF
ncbi:MAG: plasmid stabilization system protein ParE [Akkermansiaceae bacterium]